MVGLDNKVTAQKLLGPNPSPVVPTPSEAQALLEKLLTGEGPDPVFCLATGHSCPQMQLKVGLGTRAECTVTSILLCLALQPFL